MEWLEQLDGKIVGLDTAPLIYFIEENKEFSGVVNPFFDAVEQGSIFLVTSVVTLLEVLVHPLRHGDADLAEQYRNILLGSYNVKTYPITTKTAEHAARLRAETNLRTPDAIQLATAIDHEADAFLTNDRSIDARDDIEILEIRTLLADS